MAASSSRCDQQLATSPNPYHHTILTPAPPSTLALRSSPTSISMESSTTPILPTTSTSLLTPFTSSQSPPRQFPEPNPWFITLLKTKFHGPCPIHAHLRKNYQNLFCVDHAEKICSYCCQEDHPHKNTDSPCTMLHVSRYMYHDVLLAKEASSLLDIAEVQTYLNNGNRVVYIDRSAQPKSKLAPHAKSCVICSRICQNPYRFCSLICQLRYVNGLAAPNTIPLPDASPLLQPTIKEVISQVVTGISMSTSAAGKLECERRRADSATPSPLGAPVMSHPENAVKATDAQSPPHLASIKKHRHKAVPSRSLLPSVPLLMLADVATALIFDEGVQHIQYL